MSEREFNQIFAERLRYYLTKYEITTTRTFKTSRCWYYFCI